MDTGVAASDNHEVDLTAPHRRQPPLRAGHSAAAQLITELAEAHVRAGAAVTISTSRLRYDGPAVRLPARETFNGVRVRRVWTSRFGRVRLIGRVIDYATFYLLAFIATIQAKTVPLLERAKA